MALRHSLAALVVPLLFAACGDSKGTSAGAGGSSHQGVIDETAGTGGSSANATAGSSSHAGASQSGSNFGGSNQTSHGGQAGSPPSSGVSGQGGTAGLSTAGAASGGTTSGGTPGTAGNGGMAPPSGIPGNWIPVTGVDASKVPGPNFETVQYMFKGLPCSGSSCHFGGRNHLQVDKTPDQLYTYMKNLKTLECGKLIDTANPSQSALVKYLRGPCGAIERMPQYTCVDDGDERCVPEYYIQFIEQWIAAGAPR
jgi:hypothetical protein